ncbi:MAG TPA: preprotein translocase subunit SecE [Acidimicrobiales bacterium]|nr:preprotein translocase subunit SecE [Acidimicrobiales bacterium]
MNREMKRMMQRQGQIEADGSPAVRRTAPPRRPAPQAETSVPSRVAEFFREVRSELRQVAWPTRVEVANSATIVFMTLVLLVSLIFLLNYAFSHAVTFLFNA